MGISRCMRRIGTALDGSDRVDSCHPHLSAKTWI